ncbi:MAG: YceI family protein [Alphaproteobacteria bacterium]|nr:YceI family protein [Alphaproteobacteria bacterium]
MSLLFSAAVLLSSSLALADDTPSQQDPAATDAPMEEEAAPAAGPTTYTIDPAKGLLYVQVFKDQSTVAAGLSHDHVMQAKGYSGSFTWNPDDPSSCKVDVTVPVAQLDVDPQWLRDKVGYEGELSDGDRKSIRKNMLAKDQLNGESFPTISFASKSCAGSGGSVKVQGDMTLRGQTKPVTVTLKVDADGSTLTATGAFQARGSDFGLEPFSAMLGALKNRDDLSWSVQLVGAAQ